MTASCESDVLTTRPPSHFAVVSCHWVVDAENHDLNENGAEDETDREVNGYDGWRGDLAAKVAGDTEASVNAARVAVRQLLLCLSASYSLQWNTLNLFGNFLPLSSHHTKWLIHFNCVIT